MCVNYLENYEFIRFTEVVDLDTDNANSPRSGRDTDRLLYPTQLGVAALSSSFPPHQSLLVFAELQRARRNFCLDDDLHLVYLVTPLYCYEVSANMEWMNFMSLIEALPVSSKRISKLVGVDEGFITRAIRGNINMNSPADRSKVDVHKRFYSALVLSDLINEVPLNEVSKKYSVSRGQLQTLQQSAGTFAGMVTVFCNRLGWKSLSMLLCSFQSRLNFGIHQELIELVRISVLNAQRARLLFSAGYHTVVHLANADAGAIEQVLRNRNPFKSKRKSETVAKNNDDDPRGKDTEEKKIWVLGAKGAISEKEAASVIISEAKQLVIDDLRLMGINLLNEFGGQNNRADRSLTDRTDSTNPNKKDSEAKKSRFSILEHSLFNVSKSKNNEEKQGSQLNGTSSGVKRKQRNSSHVSNVSVSNAASSSSSPVPPPAKRPSFELSKDKTESEETNTSFVMTNTEKPSGNKELDVSSVSRKESNNPNTEKEKMTTDKDIQTSNAVQNSALANVSAATVLRKNSSNVETSFRFEDIEMSSTPFLAKRSASNKSIKQSDIKILAQRNSTEEQENCFEGNNSLLLSSNHNSMKFSQKRAYLSGSGTRDSLLLNSAITKNLSGNKSRESIAAAAANSAALLNVESIVFNCSEASSNSLRARKPLTSVQNTISSVAETPDKTGSLIYFVNKPLHDSSGALSRRCSLSRLQSELTSDLSCLALDSPCNVQTKSLTAKNVRVDSEFSFCSKLRLTFFRSQTHIVFTTKKSKNNFSNCIIGASKMLTKMLIYRSISCINNCLKESTLKIQ